ncbi:hypothetical protein [Rhizobium mongolense]|uniref:Uncharacterized protein n=2 Tax=Rhizobium mongolense TaxID=57676 RepID=A0ABR6IJS7_9HYPH|nr:hypothetical protein [Rhizobium mongolense]MBB4228133.1 hypothetical protein [Rhizobium mongolense]TVZ64720.1 hypothetical protein BCL32_4984 [Rhizobium mongolense USDA 1844]
MPDVPALFDFSILLRREDAHPSRRFFYAFEGYAGWRRRSHLSLRPSRMLRLKRVMFIVPPGEFERHIEDGVELTGLGF